MGNVAEKKSSKLVGVLTNLRFVYQLLGGSNMQQIYGNFEDDKKMLPKIARNPQESHRGAFLQRCVGPPFSAAGNLAKSAYCGKM